ncbi:diguanylate cyclase [Campylobacterota bacterium DY0563]
MTHKILVSDNDIKLVAFLQEIIKDRRFQFILALSLEQVLEQLESETFFAAIVDFEKTDDNGKKIVEYILEKKIPTIATVEELTSTKYEELLKYPIIDYVINNNYAGKYYLADLLQGLEYFNGRKVLICYDNKKADKLESLVQIFNSLLFEPLLATSIKEAKSIISRESNLKIIYIDESIKGGSGIELCREIKQDINFKDSIIFSGAQNKNDLMELKEIRGKFYKSGVKDFISIPIDKEEFNTNILSMMKIIKQKNRLDTYVETVDKYVLISITNLKGIIVYASDAFCKISGYSKKELIGKSHNIVRHPEMPSSIYEDLWKSIKKGEVWSGEIKNRKKNGDFYWVNVKIEPIYDAFGEVMGYQSVRFDITDKKLVEELSLTDSLLGIHNRRKFNGIIDYQFTVWRRFREPFSIIFADLDDFKSVNDFYGHSQGDRVLIEFTNVINKTIRDVDSFCRWGGEEFIIICPYTDEKGAQILAQKARTALENYEFTDIGQKTASFGVSTVNEKDTIDTLIERADAALYKAKQLGKNRVEFL